MTTSLGESLRRARESRGVSLDAVAQNTRISRRYLNALESGDLDVLPGGAFDTGYIRSYASFLGVEAEPFLKAYAAEKRPARQGSLVHDLNRLLPNREPERRRHALAWAVLAVLLVGLGAFAYKLWWVPRAPEAPAVPSGKPVSTLKRDQRSAEPEPEPAVAGEAEETEQTEAAKEIEETTGGAPTLSIPTFGVGTDVVERRLVGRSDRFEEGTTVWFWTLVQGGKNGEHVRHVWKHEGRVVMEAELSVGGSYWRTYSRIELPVGATGGWSAEVQSAEGRTLARSEFECVSAATDSGP